jgi:hypothetical protein
MIHLALANNQPARREILYSCCITGDKQPGEGQYTIIQKKDVEFCQMSDGIERNKPGEVHFLLQPIRRFIELAASN